MTLLVAPTADLDPRPRPTEPDEPLPAALEVVAWTDPSFDLNGHDPRSQYVEQFWLGILGPSSTILKHYGSRRRLRPDLARP